MLWALFCVEFFVVAESISDADARLGIAAITALVITVAQKKTAPPDKLLRGISNLRSLGENRRRCIGLSFTLFDCKSGAV